MSVSLESAPSAGRTTRDALLDGRVIYEQPAQGYRVAVEAPLLARFAATSTRRCFDHVIDLGSGPGAIALMLVVTGAARRATAVEIDATHAVLARRNAELNGVADRVRVLEQDVGSVRDETADLVIANPPWFEPGQGNLAVGASRAAARAFVRGSLASFVRAAGRLLGSRGRVVVTMPASRTTELLDVLAATGLHPKRMRFVHPRPHREAQVVFVEAKRARPGGLVIEPPLCVRGDGEAYASEVEETLRGRWSTPLAPKD